VDSKFARSALPRQDPSKIPRTLISRITPNNHPDRPRQRHKPFPFVWYVIENTISGPSLIKL